MHTFQIGEDLQVFITGGKAHIGAAALGLPYNTTNASASVLSAVGHKESQLALQTAERLSGKLRKRVAVTMGIHYDNITHKEIDEIKKIVIQLTELLIKRLMHN